MIKKVQIKLKPKDASDINSITLCVSEEFNIRITDITYVDIIKRSVDARQRNVKINLTLEIYILEPFRKSNKFVFNFNNVENAKEVIIVGSGPAGLFAALELLSKGIKPIIVERGKDVRSRRKDLAILTKEHFVNSDSNYCFGEGGAGTYSDGKLYTRSKKRGDVNNILDLLVYHGANPNIKIDAHPHVGTDKLPKIIKAIRETIISCGGDILFNSRVIDIIIKNNKVNGVVLKNGDTIHSNKVILATGHSARDIFLLLDRKNIALEAKPFAIGVRVEHSQELIDQIQYNCEHRGEYLPPAPYSFVNQVNGRGVYSFCMCPGGIIAPCATSPGEVVTNGWSPSRRNYKTSNSGIVVELKLKDFSKYDKHGPLSGMYFQKDIEQSAFKIAGETQKVPAQRLVDFINNKKSSFIPKTSYFPGTKSVELRGLFPNFLSDNLNIGFQKIGDKMKGYLTNEAVVHAPESRTSSPVRIPRDKISLQHPQVIGLFPCGEGAGYAGGIISAAIDGQKCARRASVI